MISAKLVTALIFAASTVAQHQTPEEKNTKLRDVMQRVPQQCEHEQYVACRATAEQEFAKCPEQDVNCRCKTVEAVLQVCSTNCQTPVDPSIDAALHNDFSQACGRPMARDFESLRSFLKFWDKADLQDDEEEDEEEDEDDDEPCDGQGDEGEDDEEDEDEEDDCDNGDDSDDGTGWMIKKLQGKFGGDMSVQAANADLKVMPAATRRAYVCKETPCQDYDFTDAELYYSGEKMAESDDDWDMELEGEEEQDEDEASSTDDAHKPLNTKDMYDEDTKKQYFSDEYPVEDVDAETEYLGDSGDDDGLDDVIANINGFGQPRRILDRLPFFRSRAKSGNDRVGNDNPPQERLPQQPDLAPVPVPAPSPSPAPAPNAPQMNLPVDDEQDSGSVSEPVETTTPPLPTDTTDTVEPIDDVEQEDDDEEEESVTVEEPLSSGVVEDAVSSTAPSQAASSAIEAAPTDSISNPMQPISDAIEEEKSESNLQDEVAEQLPLDDTTSLGYNSSFYSSKPRVNIAQKLMRKKAAVVNNDQVEAYQAKKPKGNEEEEEEDYDDCDPELERLLAANSTITNSTIANTTTNHTKVANTTSVSYESAAGVVSYFNMTYCVCTAFIGYLIYQVIIV